MPKQGYTQLSSGFWTKDSDASSPYLFDGAQMVFMGAGGSGGGSVDVLGTVIETFTDNTEAPKDGDTLQDTLNKFYTLDKALPEEVRAVSLTGFSTSNTKIVASDTIVQALGKAQGQIDNIPAPPMAYTDAKVRAVKLTGLATTSDTPVTVDDTILTAFGKLQAQVTSQAGVIADLTARLEALEGA